MVEEQHSHLEIAIVKLFNQILPTKLIIEIINLDDDFDKFSLRV